MGRARSFGVWTQRIGIAVVVALVVGFAVRVGSSSSQSLDFRDPLVWLVSAATGEVVQADSGSGEVTARVPAGNPADSMSILQHGPDAVLLNRTTGEIARVDGSTLQITQRTPVPADPESRLIGYGDVARLVTAAGVATVDPATATVGALTDIAGLRSTVVGDDGTVWGLDPNRRLTAVQDDSVVEVRMPETTRPFGLVAVDGAGYLLDGSGPTLRALDGSTLDLGDDECVGGDVSTDTQLGAATEGSSVVVLADPVTRTVRMSDVATGTCTSAVVEGVQDVRFGRGVESDGFAYVPLVSSGEVVIIDVDDGVVRNRVSVTTPDRDIELIVKDGVVWFNDPAGAAAGVLDEDGVRRQIDKFAQVEVSASPDQGGQPTVVPGDGTSDDGDDGTDPNVNTDSGGSGSGVASGVSTTGATDGPSPATDPSGLVADFTYSKRQVEVGEEVTFVDRSQGNPTAWTWDFGDGSFSTGPEAKHSWDAVGAYKVMLRIESPNGSAAATATIEVIDENTRTRPDADFRFSASRVEVGQPVTFTDRSTGNPQELEWDFGDGTTATGPEVEHSWSTAGTYLVRLIATNPLGSDTSPPAEITVYDRVEKPTAVISASATNVGVNQTVTFTSRSTGNPTLIRWDFGGGVEKTGETVTHAWPQPGRYPVRLYVENSAGSDDELLEVVVEARMVRPEARIRVSADTVEVGTTVRFTSLSINEPRTLTWHWNDGSPAETVPGSTLTVSHTFRTAGRFEVRLVASNDVGEDDETVVINVIDNVAPPIPAFDHSPASPVRAGQVVEFRDRSTGGPGANWRWIWDDGTRDGSGRVATHIFREPGTYNVRLEVSNSGGTRISDPQTIRVLPPAPSAECSYRGRARVGEDVVFIGSTNGRGVRWEWNFGDGTPIDTRQNPTHRFAERRTYTVTLIVRNDGGESAPCTVRVDVDPRPPAGNISISAGTTFTTDVTAQFSFAPSPNSGTPETYSWRFSDGSGSSNAESVSRSFAAGTHRVWLTVSNGNNPPVEIGPVEFRVRPVARIEAASAGIVGEEVTFTGRSSGPVETWSWQFPGNVTRTGQTVRYAFPSTGGPFTVRLTVTSGGQTSAAATHEIRIYPKAEASITPPTGTITAGTPFRFTGTATGGTAAWTYRGPAEGSGEANGTITFPRMGRYTVRLTVSNEGGSSDFDEVTVDVRPAAPRAVCAATNDGANGRVRLDGSGTSAEDATYSWNLDGGTATRTDQPTIVATFPGEREHRVVLTVANVTGSNTCEVRVPPRPSTAFTISPLPTSLLPVVFTAAETGPIEKITWIVNDEELEGDGRTFSRRFPVGEYTVRMRIETLWGELLSDPQSFEIVL